MLEKVVAKERIEEFAFNVHRRVGVSGKGALDYPSVFGPTSSIIAARNVQASEKTTYAMLQRSVSLPAGVGISVGQKQDCTGLGRNCPCSSCIEHYAPAREDYVHPIDQLLSEIESDKDTSST